MVKVNSERFFYLLRNFSKVFAGGKTDSESGQKYNIKKVVVHERFRRTTAGVVNDIAVITMKTEFEFGSNIQPICLPFMKSSVPDSGSTVIASGWGNTKPKTPSCSPNLLRADLQIFDFENSLCKNFIHNFSPKYSVLCVHSILSCTCDGDSGGPLTMEVDGVCTLVGITSQGFQCGIEGYGSLHMNVSYYLDWIIDNISKHKFIHHFRQVMKGSLSIRKSKEDYGNCLTVDDTIMLAPGNCKQIDSGAISLTKQLDIPLLNE
nr:CLIP domain-containing serine protease 14D-like [Lepeophtheirus salmonis]